MKFCGFELSINWLWYLQIKESEEKSSQAMKIVKDVGLDPIEDEHVGLRNWPITNNLIHAIIRTFRKKLKPIERNFIT